MLSSLVVVLMGSGKSSSIKILSSPRFSKEFTIPTTKSLFMRSKNRVPRFVNIYDIKGEVKREIILDDEIIKKIHSPGPFQIEESVEPLATRIIK